MSSSNHNQLQPYHTQYAGARSFGSSSSQPVCSIMSQKENTVKEANKRYAAINDEAIKAMAQDESQRRVNMLAPTTENATRNAYSMQNTEAPHGILSQKNNFIARQLHQPMMNSAEMNNGSVLSAAGKISAQSTITADASSIYQQRQK